MVAAFDEIMCKSQSVKQLPESYTVIPPAVLIDKEHAIASVVHFEDLLLIFYKTQGPVIYPEGVLTCALFTDKKLILLIKSAILYQTGSRFISRCRPHSNRLYWSLLHLWQVSCLYHKKQNFSTIGWTNSMHPCVRFH